MAWDRRASGADIDGRKKSAHERSECEPCERNFRIAERTLTIEWEPAWEIPPKYTVQYSAESAENPPVHRLENSPQPSENPPENLTKTTDRPNWRSFLAEVRTFFQ